MPYSNTIRENLELVNDIDTVLRLHGLYLLSEWIIQCLEYLVLQGPLFNLTNDQIAVKVFNIFVECGNLRECHAQENYTGIIPSSQYLYENLHGKPLIPPGKYHLLQVDEILNIGSPNETRLDPHSKRLLKLNLTDGISNIVGIELIPLSGLQPNSLPGLKIMINDKAIVRRGALCLTPACCRVIGGEILKQANSISSDSNIIDLNNSSATLNSDIQISVNEALKPSNIALIVPHPSFQHQARSISFQNMSDFQCASTNELIKSKDIITNCNNLDEVIDLSYSRASLNSEYSTSLQHENILMNNQRDFEGNSKSKTNLYYKVNPTKENDGDIISDSMVIDSEYTAINNDEMAKDFTNVWESFPKYAEGFNNSLTVDNLDVKAESHNLSVDNTNQFDSLNPKKQASIFNRSPHLNSMNSIESDSKNFNTSIIDNEQVNLSYLSSFENGKKNSVEFIVEGNKMISKCSNRLSSFRTILNNYSKSNLNGIIRGVAVGITKFKLSAQDQISDGNIPKREFQVSLLVDDGNDVVECCVNSIVCEHFLGITAVEYNDIHSKKSKKDAKQYKEIIMKKFQNFHGAFHVRFTHQSSDESTGQMYSSQDFKSYQVTLLEEIKHTAEIFITSQLES